MKPLLMKRLSLIMSLTFATGLGYAQSETGDSAPANPPPGVGQEPLLEAQSIPLQPSVVAVQASPPRIKQGIPVGGFLLSPELVLKRNLR